MQYTDANPDQDGSAASQNLDDDHEQPPNEDDEAQHADAADGGAAGCSHAGIIDSLLQDFTDSTLLANQHSSHQGSHDEMPNEENLQFDESIPVASLHHSDVEETLWKTTLTFEKVCAVMYLLFWT